MKPQKQAEPQEDNAQLALEVRRDAIQFAAWLETQQGQDWLDEAINEDADRCCRSDWEGW